jgi:hypothetical protein
MKITKFLKQYAVYWGNPQPDGYGGYTFDEPRELKVRWTDKKEIIMAKTKNVSTWREQVSKSKIMLDEDVDLGGMLSLMRLTDLSSSMLPEDNNAYEIVNFQKTPGVRASNFVRQAWL